MGDQVYTFSQLQTGVTHALAGAPNVQNPAGVLVNRALNYIVNQRNWSWRQRPLNIDVLSVAVAAITRTNSNATLNVQTSSPHGQQAGWYVQLAGTTSASGNSLNMGYNVQSVIDSTHIQLVSPFPSDSSSITLSSAVIVPGQVALPADFTSSRLLYTSPQSGYDCYPVDLGDLIVRRRSTDVTVAGGDIYYAISWLPQASSTVEPVAYISFFPVPSQSTYTMFQGTYLRKVPALQSGSDIPDVPSQYMDLIYHGARVFAVLTEEGKQSPEAPMLMSMLQSFAEDDANLQRPQAGFRRSVQRTPALNDLFPVASDAPQQPVAGAA